MNKNQTTLLEIKNIIKEKHSDYKKTIDIYNKVCRKKLSENKNKYYLKIIYFDYDKNELVIKIGNENTVDIININPNKKEKVNKLTRFLNRKLYKNLESIKDTLDIAYYRLKEYEKYKFTLMDNYYNFNINIDLNNIKIDFYNMGYFKYDFNEKKYLASKNYEVLLNPKLCNEDSLFEEIAIQNDECPEVLKSHKEYIKTKKKNTIK